MSTSVVPTSWRDAFRRHERALAAAWFVLSFGLIALVVLRPTRVALLGGIQRVADYWDGRWERRLEAGEQLVAAKRYDDAVQYLERLDREYPAPHFRYGRDKEREHLLRLLAASYEGLGKNAGTMQAWTRLTLFDSLNHANHFGYAQAAERLLSGWALAEEAKDGFARVLTLLPSHLPALRGYIDYYMDRGEFPPVVAAHRTYLDSFLIGHVSITAGDSTIHVPMQVDGRPHDVEVALPISGGWTGDLLIGNGVYPMAVESAVLVPAAHVGVAGARVPRALDLAALAATGMVRQGAAWVPTQADARLRLPVSVEAAGASRVLLRLRVFKLIDAPLLGLVRKSHRNLLDKAGLAETEARSAAFPTIAGADSAFARIEWLKAGQYVRGER